MKTDIQIVYLLGNLQTCKLNLASLSVSARLKGILERGKEELAEAEVIKDSPDSPEPPNKKPLVEMDETPHMEKSKGEDSPRSQAVFSRALVCSIT